MAPEPVRSTNNAVIQRRPQRWSEPFGVRMTATDVERLLAIEPFRSMDRGRFPKLVPLRGLLLNDTRVSRYEEGEIIIREGDYGHSAFLILSGKVDVSLRGLPPRVLGRTSGRQQSWWDAFLSSVGAPRVREARDATLDMPKLIIPSLQVNMRAGQLPPKDESGKTFLKVPVNGL